MGQQEPDKSSVDKCRVPSLGKNSVMPEYKLRKDFLSRLVEKEMGIFVNTKVNVGQQRILISQEGQQHPGLC